MSVQSLSIVLNLIDKEKYNEETIKNCIIKTCIKTGEDFGDVLDTLLEELTKSAKFSVTLDGYGSFKNVEDAVTKMKNIVIKNGVSEKINFKFTFKDFNKKNFGNVDVLIEHDFGKKFNLISHPFGFQEKTLEKLMSASYSTIVYLIKLRHFMYTELNYDHTSEGNDKELHELTEKERKNKNQPNSANFMEKYMKTLNFEQNYW